MGFLSIVLSKWRIIGVGILLAIMAGMFAYIEILKLQRADLATENKSIKFQLQASQSNVKKLSDDIRLQNTAIDELKKDADTRLSKAADDLKKAKFQSASFKKIADDFMSRKPPEGLPLCQAADDLFNEAIRKNANP